MTLPLADVHRFLCLLRRRFFLKFLKIHWLRVPFGKQFERILSFSLLFSFGLKLLILIIEQPILIAFPSEMRVHLSLQLRQHVIGLVDLPHLLLEMAVIACFQAMIHRN